MERWGGEGKREEGNVGEKEGRRGTTPRF